MKKLKRILAVLLTLCLLFSMVPMTASATETGSDTAVTSTDSDFQRILHLDCGRKYFTKDWIIALINEMAAAGYTHLQLAFGNDGLRFLLDDMSVTVGETTYSHADFVSAVETGNADQNSSGDKSWLTESEMDAIIAHANSVGIEIIPLLNNPGHMDSMVTALNTLLGTDVGYNGSEGTIDLENETAVAATKAILQKYIDYFAANGSTIFNIGADEYANDIYTDGAMGFGQLVSAGDYQLFVDYVNSLNALVKEAGMKTMAFNDGIYFQNQTSYAFDTDIIVSFWSSGWGSGTGAYGAYASASASTMASMGHPMVNTHGDYYYILGKNDGYTSGTTTTHAGQDYTYAEGFSNTAFMSSTVSEPAGSTFCVWCDYPNAETETEVAQYIRPILRVMGARMNDSTEYDVDTIVSGGFNEDGTINTDTTEATPTPAPTATPAPEVEDVTKTDEKTGVKVTTLGLSGLTVTETTAPTIENALNVLAWDMALATAEGSYTGEATVSVPVPEDWSNVRGGVLASDNGEEVLGIEGTVKDGMFTFTVPHFSTVVTYDLDTSVTIDLTVGEEKTVTDSTGNYEDTYSSDGLDTTIAEVSVDGDTVPGGSTVTALTSLTAGDTFYIQVSDGVYLTSDGDTTTDLSAAETWTAYGVYTTYCTVRNSSNAYLGVDYDGVPYTTASYASYLKMSDGQLVGYYSGHAAGTPVKVTATDPVDATNITFKGISVGTTYVTVGETTYKIVVSKANITSAVVVDGTKTYTDTSAAIVSNTDAFVATATLENGTLTITGLKVGETVITTTNAIYNVTVTTVDLTTVDPLKIEYFITNQRVTINDVTTKEVAAADVYSEDGVAFADLVPASDGADNPKVFWKGWLLPDGYHQEADENVSNAPDRCTDENGKLIQKIRYWNDEWQYFNGSEWSTVNDTDQIVAYYLQQTEVTDEVTTNVTDWGETYKTWSEQGSSHWFFRDYVIPSNRLGFVFLDFAVVYEDGTQTPLTSDFPVDDTWFFHFDGCSEENPRVLKPISFDETGDYEIWKITLTDGTSSGYNTYGQITADDFVSTYDDTTETVVWSEEMGGTPHIDSITYTANTTGKLIRVYVRAVETEDTLTVVYYDEKFGDTLYTYNISVKSDVNFTTGIVGSTDFTDNTARIDVSNAYIVNALEKNQYFETDLTLVPEAKGKYNSELYKYTGSVISTDGKTLYLYYNINESALSPNFVVDFGLPITFPLSNVVTNVGAVDSVGALSARYGTLTYDAEDQEFTYTPTQILPNIDVLSITLTITGETSTTNVGVTPATTVYYEEGFLFNDDSTGWSDTANKGKGTQATEVLGESSHYGYDPHYADNLTGSDGSAATTATIGDQTEFTFTGTGFELYANCDGGTGYVAVKNATTEKTVKLYAVNTQVASGDTTATTGQSGDFYSLPIISEKDLEHGTYTVTVKKTRDTNDIRIDGVRITNTINDLTDGEGNIYYGDQEDNPEFYQLRDVVLNAINIDDDTSEDYGTLAEMAEQVYNELVSTDGEAPSALITGASDIYGEEEGKTASELAQDLLDNGPKNEVYLYEGQTLTFKVETNRVMQLGLKAPKGNGNSVNYTLSVTAKEGETAVTLDQSKLDVGTSRNLMTSVDMFYKIADNVADTTESDGTTTEHKYIYTVSVTNNSDNNNATNTVLSITDLKICDDPNAAFVPLTVEDIKTILGGDETSGEEITEPEEGTEGEEGGEGETPVDPEDPTEEGTEGDTEAETPVEPEIVYADAVLTVSAVDYTGAQIAEAALTVNGVAGETNVFTADEIESAIAAQLPEGYALAADAEDAEVVFGETGTASVQVGKVATLNVVYINMRGKKVGTATITSVQTSAKTTCRVSAAEIRSMAPSGKYALYFFPATVAYGSTGTVVVPVL